MADLDQTPDGSRSSFQADTGSDQLDELLHLVRAAKIPNGLLFTGAPGTGKSKAAAFLARACNCARGPGIPCDACSSCKKLRAGMHPDYIRLEPEEGKTTITIAQIREMGRMLSARPNEAANRVVCILDAHLMNVQAQNALLKVLEEPPEQTFFILCADDGAPLLPTIHSRCRHLRFRPVSLEQACRTLTLSHGMPPETARIAAQTLGPDVDRILALFPLGPSGDAPWMHARKRLIQTLLDLMANRASALKALDLSRHLCTLPDKASWALAVIRTLVRDLALFRHSPEKIVNLDFFPAFEDISQMHGESTFLEWVDCFHQTQRRMDANCGLRLALDAFFLTLSSPPGPGPRPAAGAQQRQ